MRKQKCARQRLFWVATALAAATFEQGGMMAAAEKTDLQVYYGNTVFCQDTSTKAICRLFLDQDGTYEVFYYYGKRDRIAGLDGPFEQEGRDGKFSLKDEGGAQQVCLAPNAVGAHLQMESLHVLYGEPTCYVLAMHSVGDKWQQVAPDGHTYNLWLLKGR